MKPILAAILFIAFTASVFADEDHLVKNVPGYVGPPIKFKHYAGYITVNETVGRNLFYWFVESQRNPETDPFVVWLNGGPGCSSMLGFLTEHGPFTLQRNKTMTPTPDSWNKVANMLYIEAPAGVGYSYSVDSSDLYKDLGDDKTAMSNYIFLGKFFEKYPKFKNHDLWITGESYAGHYVPTLANTIFDGNQKGTFPKMNLKGFVVGNGLMDAEADGNSKPPFLWQHAFIGADLYNETHTHCKGEFYKNQHLPECGRRLTVIFNTVWSSGLNPYNVYQDCYNGPNEGIEVIRKMDVGIHPLFTLANRVEVQGPNSVPPCTEAGYIQSYLSSKEVKHELHAKESIQWQMCNSLINMNYNRKYKTMLPIYQKLIAAGLRTMVYSGDLDGAVNVMGSQDSARKLDMPTVKPFSKWILNNQVAGFSVDYKGLRFVTVKGAGHMVPTDKGPQALHMFSTFLDNKPI